ncbi:MAG TPA: acyl-CoA dehydrogenase family protein [Burkholderiaceae bacterium]|nr:acyl-CoA dehydrogenase family protein [Burkholderiaceae bacterium]
MNFADIPEHIAFRARAREWIAANAPWEHLDAVRRLRFAGGGAEDDHESLVMAQRWQKKKFDAGWACLVWPKSYGGQGLGPAENVIFQEEEGHFTELSNPFLIGQGFIAPTLMKYATEEQKCRLLPPLASGESIWCQLFSEPGAGSDLAGVRTRAERRGDSWRINGQKVWTSGAHYSEWGLLLARTDPDVPKHAGITMFFVRMNSPGITVRPVRQLSGAAHFNEVFFDDVDVPDEQRLGTVNNGWHVALTTLTNERMALGATVPVGFDELFDLASQPGADGVAPIESEHVRMQLADWYAKVSGMRFGVYRQLTAMAQGRSPGAEAAVGKLAGASATQDIAAFGLDLLGARGRAADAGNTHGGVRAETFHAMFAFGAIHRLEGGTDEVLRNIIAERVLGLPPDVRTDRGPFRDVPTAPAKSV